jgi:hypothetical protein
MADVQRINGNAYSWSSIVIKLDGQRFFGITSITFNDKLEVGYGYGQGRHFAPLSRTGGKYSCDESKIVMRTSSFADFQEYLKTRSPDGISIGFPEWTVDSQWVEPNQLALSPMQAVLSRCRLTGVNQSQEQSTDETTVELAVSVMYIVRNGATLFDASRGFPG